jgi:hypothetical protein
MGLGGRWEWEDGEENRKEIDDRNRRIGEWC